MDGKFIQKVSLVSNVHETEYIHKWDTYSSVLSQDWVWIAFLYTALKNWIFCYAASLTLILNHHVVRNYGLCQENNLVVWLVHRCKLIEHCRDSNIQVNLGIRLYLQLYQIWTLNLSGKTQIFVFKFLLIQKVEKYQEWIVVYVDDLLAIRKNPKAIIDFFSMYDLKDTVIPSDW